MRRNRIYKERAKVTVSAEKELLDKLEAYAKGQQRTLSSLFREIAMDFLNKKEREKEFTTIT